MGLQGLGESGKFMADYASTTILYLRQKINPIPWECRNITQKATFFATTKQHFGEFYHG